MDTEEVQRVLERVGIIIKPHQEFDTKYSFAVKGVCSSSKGSSS